MKIGAALIAIVITVCFCAILPASADFAKAQEAYLLKDYATAMQEYKKEDDPRAMYQIGYMYDHGEGVPQDNKSAVEWYLKAAEKGHARSQYRLGLFYATGTGVEKNLKESEKWYRKAAGQGFRPAKDALKKLEVNK
jgi:TPR repeat protein